MPEILPNELEFSLTGEATAFSVAEFRSECRKGPDHSFEKCMTAIKGGYFIEARDHTGKLFLSAGIIPHERESNEGEEISFTPLHPLVEKEMVLEFVEACVHPLLTDFPFQEICHDLLTLIGVTDNLVTDTAFVKPIERSEQKLRSFFRDVAGYEELEINSSITANPSSVLLAATEDGIWLNALRFVNVLKKPIISSGNHQINLRFSSLYQCMHQSINETFQLDCPKSIATPPVI